MILSGSTVNTWKDKSGNGYNFTQTSYSTSLPPLSNITTGTGVYFGSLQGLFNTSFPFPTTYTIFSVANQTTNTGGYQYILHSPYNADYIIFFGALNGNFATFTGSGGWNDVNANSPASSIANTSNTASIVSCTNNGTTLTPYFNAVAMTTKNGANASATGITLGDTDTAHPRQPWLGTVGEMIIYNSILSTPQREQVEGYLAWKWGLQVNLPPGHPYKNTNNNYNPFPSTTPAKTISSKAIFKPTNYPGCQLWLDAFDPFGDGSQQKSPLTLTSWVDKSANARHANMFNGSSIAYSPTAFNGKPALLFTQTQNMSSAAAAGTFPTSFTFFMIYQRTGGGTLDTLVTRTVSNVAAPTDFFTNISTGNFSRSIGNGTAYTDYNTTSGSNFTNVTTPSLYYANATAATGLLDAFNFATPTDPSSGTLTGVYYGDTATAIYIGTRADSVTTLTASVAEVIVYSTTPSDQQRQQIEGYLAWKWGLVTNLPAGHPYKNYPPPPQ